MFVHQPYGTFDLTGIDGRFTVSEPASTPAAALPLDLFVVGAREPAAIMARVRAADRPSGAAAALVVRLSAVAPHAGQPRRGASGGEDLSREEAAVRHDDLPRHRFLPVRLEHRQRRVHVQLEGVPRSEGDDSATARRSLQGRPARRPRREDADRDGRRPVHRAAAADRPHAGRQMARRPSGELLLAGAQAVVRRRRRRLVARSGRRPRPALTPGAQPDVLRTAAGSGGPTSACSRCTATATPGCSATAPSSGRATCFRRGRR